MKCKVAFLPFIFVQILKTLIDGRRRLTNDEDLLCRRPIPLAKL